MNKNEKGYTIIELMIALSLSMITIGFIYEAYFISARMLKNWQDKIRCEDTALICMDSLCRDVLRSVDFKNTGESETTLIGDDDRAIVYRFHDGNLFRNGFQINPPSVRVDRVIIRNINATEIAEFSDRAATYSTFDLRPSIDTTDAVIPVSVEFAAHNKTKQISLRSAVLPRNLLKHAFDVHPEL
jgi:type II secretory pathway component PulJ